MSAAPIAARVLDAMADAVIAGERTGRVTLWSLGAQRLFGWTEAEALGHDFKGWADDDARAEAVAALERVWAGEHVSLATRGRRSDGGVVDLWIVLSPMRAWLGGPIDGWLAVVRDSSREVEAQRELRSRVELVSRLASVVTAVNSELDLSTVLQRVSESGRELVHADGAAYVVLDRDALRIAAVSGMPASIVDEFIPLAESAVAAVLANGTASMELPNDAYPNSSVAVREVCRRLPRLAVALTRIDGQLSGALYVFFTAERLGLGRPELGVLELLADAAGVALSNAHAYQLLRDQRQHERAVVEAMADGVAVLDAAGLVRQWNPAARGLTGIEEADAIGKPLPFPVHEPGVMADHELPTGRWLEIVGAPIGASGETVVSFRDITRAKAIEASKDLFLAVTSHELRTPITVVRGYTSTLLTHWEQLTDDERRESVGRIAERTKALGALVEQLLLGSRAGSVAPPQEAVPFDLVGLLRTALAGFSAITSAHELRLELEPDLPPAVGDPSSVEIALSQLIENAVKYSPDGGEVTISACRAADDRITVAICDRGIGIPDGEHEAIFERFYQVGGERRRFGGVGLGLYIVRKLLDAQGGSVRARPRAGGGTCFEVSLPATPPAARTRTE